MVFRIEPSVIAFSLIGLTSPCSGNNFSQYRIWDPKDSSRAIVWVSSCPFPTDPSFVMVLFSTRSATSASVCSTACPLLVVIASPVFWNAVVAGAFSRVAITD